MVFGVWCFGLVDTAAWHPELPSHHILAPAVPSHLESSQLQLSLGSKDLVISKHFLSILHQVLFVVERGYSGKQCAM